MANPLQEYWRALQSAVTGRQIGVVGLVGAVFVGVARGWDTITDFVIGRGVGHPDIIPSLLIGLTAAALVLGWYLVRHIVDQNRRLRPGFKISFDPDGMGLVTVEDRLQWLHPTQQNVMLAIDVKARYLRVILDTTSESPAEGCRGYVTRLQFRPKDSDFADIKLPQPIHLLDHPLTVFPGIPAHMDFAKASQTLDLPKGILGSEDGFGGTSNGWPVVLKNAFKPHGTYRFTLRVHGPGATQTQAVDVNWFGSVDTLTARKI